MSTVRRTLNRVFLIYQRYISPLLGSHCRFYPSCSEYARQAFLYHDVLRATYYSVHRLCRCHPLGSCGHDPVPGIQTKYIHNG